MGMRSSECTILIVPGLANSGPDHWQSRWERKLPTARRVEQDDWHAPQRDAWVARLIEAVGRADKPVVLLGHSLGAATIAHAAPQLPQGIVRGAFMVGLPDVRELGFADFSPLPEAVLPFPSLLAASRTDPYCTYDYAEKHAGLWGAAFVDAGEAGHINTESGHGPWPEGLMCFAGFLQKL